MFKTKSIFISTAAVLLIGCENPTAIPSAEKVSYDLNKSLPTTSVWKGTITIKSASDTFKVTIPLVKGNSYIGTCLSEDWPAAYIRSGETLQNCNKGFTAAADGESAVFFYKGSASYPVTFIYEIKTLTPGTSGYLDGSWIITKQESGAFGIKQTADYSENDCGMYMVIRNDSIFETSLSTIPESGTEISIPSSFARDTLRTEGKSILESRLFDSPFSLNGDSIVIGFSTADGFRYKTLKKTSTPLSAITWNSRIFAPASKGITGTWFLSADFYKSKYIGQNSSVGKDTVCTSPAVSSEIIDIRSDSVIVYHKEGVPFQGMNRKAYTKAAWVHSNLTGSTLSVSGNSFTIETASVSSTSDYIFQKRTTYSSYSGAVPPAEWAVLNSKK